MYYSVQREVDRLLDDSLREVALSFDNIRSQDVVQLKRRFGNREQGVVVQIYDPISGTVALSRRMESLPVMDRVGFSDFQLDGKTWRAYTFLNPYGQIVEQLSRGSFEAKSRFKRLSRAPPAFRHDPAGRTCGLGHYRTGLSCA